MDDNKSIEEDFLIDEEEDKKSQNKETKPKEFNETDKNGISQDVPNMNTPMNSYQTQNVQNNQLKEANTNINAPKIEEEANEIEETEKKNEETNNKLDVKDINENPDKEENKINDINEEIKEDEKKEEPKNEIKEDEKKEEEKKEDEKKEEEKKEDENKEDEKKENEIKEEEKKENEEPKLNKEESHEIKFSPENKDTKETKNDKIPDDENLIYPNEEDFDLKEAEDKKKQNIIEDEDQKEKGELANDINNPSQNNLQYNNIEGQQEDLNQYENLPQQNIDEYPQMEGQYNYNEPIITIKDLQEHPKQKLLINSPYSLKALYDCGITMNELYYRNLDEFTNEHKEVLHISEDARFNRFNFYEQLRLDKIDNLVKYREKLIKDDQMKTTPKGNSRLKPMKKIIIDNHIRIAKDEIDSVQKRHEKELANIIELELDKDLFNLEIYKQEENYNKEYEKLNFLNLNSAGEETDNMNENENENENENGNEQQEREYRYKDDNAENNTNYRSQNFVSASFRKKTHHIVLDEHKTYLDNLYSLQRAKVNQKYEKNQKKIAKKLERVEKVNKIKGEQMALKKRIEIERASQNLQKNAKDYQERHEKLLREIQVKKLSIYQNKKKFENYLKEKSEHNYLRYMMKLDYIESLKRRDEYLRQLKYEKLMEKQSKRENIKHERDNVLDKKFFKLDSLNKDRKRNIIKIKNILSSGIEEENLDKILQAFPGNKEIDKVIKNYRKQKKNIQSGVKPKTYLKFRDPKLRPKSHGKLMIKSVNKNKLYNTRLKHKNSDLKIPNLLSTNRKEDKDEQGDILINDNKLLPGEEQKKEVKVLYESEIREKIKQYKENIYREFFKHVEEEKKNEDLRNKQLMNVHDPQKRHELEKRFSKERALVDLRLKRENQNIQEKILSYEINLRQTNIDNQNLLQKKKI